MLRKCIAEAIGTFALVFAGTGAIIANDTFNGAVTHVGIALSFGLVVMVFIYALADISGAHFNPAVSYGFLQLRKMKASEFGFYVGSQLVGALLASSILVIMVPAHPTLGTTTPHLPVWSAFAIEVLLTFFLMFVILQVTKLGTTLPNTVGLSIGAVVALDALFGGQFTGASMNPARSIAPAVVSGNITFLWIYILAPVVGAGVAVIVSKYLLAESSSF